MGAGLEGTDLLVKIQKVRKGTKLEAGRVSATSQNGDILLRVPIGDKLGALTIAQLTGKEPVTLSVNLTLKGKSPGPVALQEAAGEGSAAVAATAPAKHSVFLAAPHLPAQVIGAATTVADIESPTRILPARGSPLEHPSSWRPNRFRARRAWMRAPISTRSASCCST